MTKKATGIVAYIGIIGWLIAYFAGDREEAKFHLNQALTLALLGLINGWIVPIIPLVGGIVSSVISVVLLVFVILGIVSAVKEEDKPLPLIGGIQLLK